MLQRPVEDLKLKWVKELPVDYDASNIDLGTDSITWIIVEPSSTEDLYHQNSLKEDTKY